ncbi:MAG: hypothetical protein Q9225_000333 [Loekoesia sp. 1 TL-2023]
MDEGTSSATHPPTVTHPQISDSLQLSIDLAPLANNSKSFSLYNQLLKERLDFFDSQRKTSDPLISACYDYLHKDTEVLLAKFQILYEEATRALDAQKVRNARKYRAQRAAYTIFAP